ncbi:MULTISPECIES: hypothetical protein [Legionella]|uniref:Uncharacterized protein n=1 Tax=Legionella septentrionalis TaxID=2498109 RepID=A0A433JMQ4_9GAMM|nr:MULTISPECIES: hypothetical protein [Legionella]MCP0913071.1 hypothetical protein [Legionella sp. 27cVA30]RUQ91522.1 hypothetical protein EKM59_00215 [Legionella septentrionalis]RUQ95004.1 hypothetical protein ELY11_10500 [Legionella septentrionalis]RUR13796.1 hypothetical protein ELY10_09990 [Legionella septentrionalis]
MLRNVWNYVKKITLAIIHYSIDFGGHLLTHTAAVPDTVKKVKDSENLRFLLANSFFINVIQFAAPFVIYRGAKKLLQEQLKNQFGDYEDYVLFQVAETSLDTAVYMVLYTRLKLRNVVYNTAATIGSTPFINEEFNTQELGSANHNKITLCQDCKITGDRLNKEVSLQVHFLWGSLAMLASQNMVKFIPYVGYPAGLLLNAYWRGFITFQYPLARKKICAEHQVHLLLAEKSFITSFGLMFNGIEALAGHVIKSMAQGNLSDAVIDASLANFLYLMSIMHAHQVDFKIPENSTTIPKLTLDPITMSWWLSLASTNLLGKSANHFLKQIERNDNDYVLKLKQFKERIAKHPVIYMGADVIKTIFIPAELKSLRKLMKSNALRPYAIVLLTELDAGLNFLNEINNSMVVSVTQVALRIPYINRYLISFGAHYAYVYVGIPPELIKLLAKAVTNVDVNTYLQSFQTEIKKIREKSMDLNNNWFNFFTLGSRLPKNWNEKEKEFTRIYDARALKNVQNDHYCNESAQKSQISPSNDFIASEILAPNETGFPYYEKDYFAKQTIEKSELGANSIKHCKLGFFTLEEDGEKAGKERDASMQAVTKKGSSLSSKIKLHENYF